MEAAIDAIDEAGRALAADPSADRWKTLRDVIEVFKMQNDHSWTDTWPKDFKRPYGDAADAFIKKAMNCRDVKRRDEEARQ